MSENKELAKFFRIYVNALDMVQARGYRLEISEGLLCSHPTVPGTFTMNMDTFEPNAFGSGSLSRETLNFSAQNIQDPSQRLYVRFLEGTSIGVTPIKTIMEGMVTDGVHRLIVVCPGKITPSAVKIMQQAAPRYIAETFEEQELQVNITLHQLVPKHEVLTATEKDTLLKRYYLKDSQLPRIQHNDPIARYYGLKRGEVVKITRSSETAGRYLTYRLCL